MEILLGGGMYHLLCLLRSSLIVWLMIEVTGHDANLLAMLTLWLNQIVTAANRPEVTTRILALVCTVLFVLRLEVGLLHCVTIRKVWRLFKAQT